MRREKSKFLASKAARFYFSGVAIAACEQQFLAGETQDLMGRKLVISWIIHVNLGHIIVRVQLDFRTCPRDNEEKV